jgi:tRNA G18 (ribose-2'-O)-methylase SpoU
MRQEQRGLGGRAQERSFKSYLILYNIMKHANFGYLIRTANAFGVSEIIIVGKRAFDVGGACGTSHSTRKRHFFTLGQACEYLRTMESVICGVEITDNALRVDGQPFEGSTAFMVGNEMSGLTKEQILHCDHFVYVPQFGTAACLNVNVAAGIALHHFALWADFEENDRRAHKFLPSPGAAVRELAAFNVSHPDNGGEQ